MKYFFTYISVLVVSSVVFVGGAQGAQAKASYYVDSATGNNANNCTSATTACKTIAAAKTKIEAQTDPRNTTLFLKGTFNEEINFDANDIDDADGLDGLRITATSTSDQPTVNGTGLTRAIFLQNIDDIEIDHLNITGGYRGIEVYGSSNKSITGAKVHHNTITDLTQTDEDVGYLWGIYLLYNKNATISNNTLDDISIDLVNSTGTNNNLYGILVWYSFDITISNNTVSDLTHTFTTDTDSASHYFYNYSIYSYGTANLTIRNNSIQRIASNATVSSNNATIYPYVYGIYTYLTTDLDIRNNTLKNITTTNEATGTGDYITGRAYGMALFDTLRQARGNNVVRNNTLTTFSGTTEAYDADAFIYGIDAADSEALMIRNNTFTRFTATGLATEEDGGAGGTIYGIMADNNYQGGTIRNNTLNNFTTSTNYSGVDGSSTHYLYAIYLDDVAEYLVQGNTIKTLTSVNDNNDVADFSDLANQAGIYANRGNDVTFKKNVISDLSLTNVTDGNSGFASTFNQYGISALNISKMQMLNNTVQNTNLRLILSGTDNDSYGYPYVYGLANIGASEAVMENNTVSGTTVFTNGGSDNRIYTRTVQLYVDTSPNTVVRNNILKTADIQASASEYVSNTFYAAQLYYSPGSLLDHNVMKNSVVQANGSDATSTLAGVYVSNSRSSYINANRMQKLTSTGNTVGKLYGVYYANDASKSNIFNNVILGTEHATAEEHTGIYLPDAPTNDVHVYHNTVTNWHRAISLQGGKHLDLKNNILTAIGSTGYPLEVARNTVHNRSLISNYNIFFNKSAKQQAVYDSDNAAEINFGDWTNRKGSYGYDWQSFKMNPRVNKKGLLKKTSKARRAGTTKYGLGKKTTAYSLLQTDINGTERNVSNPQAKSDIGADEYGTHLSKHKSNKKSKNKQK